MSSGHFVLIPVLIDFNIEGTFLALFKKHRLYFVKEVNKYSVRLDQLCGLAHYFN